MEDFKRIHRDQFNQTVLLKISNDQKPSKTKIIVYHQYPPFYIAYHANLGATLSIPLAFHFIVIFLSYS